MERCRQCDHFTVKTWSEMTDEEKKVAENRPAPDYQDMDHRRLNHSWCTNCWTELHGCGARFA